MLQRAEAPPFRNPDRRVEATATETLDKSHKKEPAVIVLNDASPDFSLEMELLCTLSSVALPLKDIQKDFGLERSNKLCRAANSLIKQGLPVEMTPPSDCRRIRLTRKLTGGEMETAERYWKLIYHE